VSLSHGANRLRKLRTDEEYEEEDKNEDKDIEIDGSNLESRLRLAK